MYDVVIEHPAIEDRNYSAADSSQLRGIIRSLALVQGKPPTEGLALHMDVELLRHACDKTGEGVLKVHDITVTLREAEGCEGHQGEDSVLLGGPEFCDGSCRPRSRFDKQKAFELMNAIDDAELDASGGCGPCGLEAGQMCAGCGKCNCHTHETCVRPASEQS
ncbi:hypothetical protein DI272_18970 [Streptomyces sp. Act143]|uniref:hypothetical protein n=1 Tax=Streptomyces sp. Act143 TaxID=2200760 RepID=UPI000D682A8C|nr:hypothetical protein [Streptomyces sp. Act143]PWI16016.1 hypothetical protein DI272_18970 [Streptomyces sp. Act143]